MTEYQNTTPQPGPGWRGSAGAIARTMTAIAAGAAVSYTTRNPGLAITSAAAALSLMREMFPPPPSQE